MKKFSALLLVALLAIMPMAAQADDLNNLLDAINDGCEVLVQYFMSEETLTDTELAVYFQCVVMYIAGASADNALTFDEQMVSTSSLALAAGVIDVYNMFESAELSNADAKAMLDRMMGAYFAVE